MSLLNILQQNGYSKLFVITMHISIFVGAIYEIAFADFGNIVLFYFV